MCDTGCVVNTGGQNGKKGRVRICRVGTEMQTSRWMCGRGGGGWRGEGGTNWEVGTGMHAPPRVRQRASGNLLCPTGSSVQCPVLT